MRFGRAAAAAALLGWGPSRGVAQEPTFRYAASSLACAVFEESVRTRVRGESGSAVVEDRAGRDGVLSMVARDSAGTILIEAWFDSLAVWRVTSAGREAPETDGVVGGRYRGSLDPSGTYRARKTPFFPADIADVSDLAGFLEEFLPRLPGTGLDVGRTWADSIGLSIRRLPDLRGRTPAVRRLQWTSNRRQADTTEVTDSLAVTVDQMIRETGELTWSDRLGPLSWTRRLEITARIPPRGGVRRPMTSSLSQDVNVARRLELERCH